jgi:L-lactate dehydrogenase
LEQICHINLWSEKKYCWKSRFLLFDDNAVVCVQVAEKVTKFPPETIIIVVMSPVDIMVVIRMEISRFPRERVINSGTPLDSTRFTSIFAQYFNILVIDMYANIFCEHKHGDSQVFIWSSVEICGQLVDYFILKDKFDFFESTKLMITEKTKSTANEIITCKQATYNGILGLIT